LTEDIGDDKPRVSIRRTLKPKVKLCPRCLKKVRPASSLGGWLIPQEYICDSCGYRGPVAIEGEPG